MDKGFQKDSKIKANNDLILHLWANDLVKSLKIHETGKRQLKTG